MKLIPVIVLSVQFLLGQNPADKLFELYRNAEYKQLAENFKELSINHKLNRDEQLLFESLLSEDGQKTFSGMMNLVKSDDGRVREIALGKIKDYYFARGYYQTANEFEKELVALPAESVLPVAEPALAGSDFHIQVGAYGFRENAERLQKMLATQNIRAEIVTRVQNAKTLYCVWISGLESLDQTMEYAQTLKEKYDLSYHIIKE
jgi:hypothetical protein